MTHGVRVMPREGEEALRVVEVAAWAARRCGRQGGPEGIGAAEECVEGNGLVKGATMGFQIFF